MKTTKKPETDPVEAASAELSQTDPGTPVETLMADAAVTTGTLDATERPSALTVDGTQWLWMPEIEGYASDEGEVLDLKQPAAVKALVAWRRHREQLRAVEAAQEERERAGPDDLHLFHVERGDHFGEFEMGRRWVALKDLQPGIHGNEGVQLEHGVCVRWAPEVDEAGKPLKGADKERSVRLLHFRITHIDEKSDVVSLEPGERLKHDAVVFHPKPYVREWLAHVAAYERTSMERWVNKLVHQAYAVSDLRTAMAAGAGMAGKRGANPEVMHDLEAGRRARAQS